jgi:membrane associated rhomboid family serine protease
MVVHEMVDLPIYVVILIEILVAFIVLWLSVRLVAGARKTGQKLVMVLLIAVIGFFVIPILEEIPVIGALGSIIGYTLIILLVHSLIDIAWDKSIIIAFIFYVVMYILSILIGSTYIGPFVP